MAFHTLDKKKTPGIDGQTAAEYAEDVRANLRDVHERLRTKQYRAAPIKREQPEKREIQKTDLGEEEQMYQVLEEFYDAQINTWVQSRTERSFAIYVRKG